MRPPNLATLLDHLTLSSKDNSFAQNESENGSESSVSEMDKPSPKVRLSK